MTSAQLINQDSGDFEYYTPPEIIEAARRVLGVIELDPFSSAKANERVRADRYFTEQDDGLKQEWRGRFWMNHPFSRVLNPLCINKAVDEFISGRAIEGLCITFAATSEGWFQPLLPFPQCYLSPRTNYYLPDGSKKVGVTKGSVVTYFWPHLHAFAREFESFGTIKTRYTPTKGATE